MNDNGERFCLKQAYKMCFYVSKLYQMEILRMKCEFYKDQNGTIWFANGSQIWVRPNMVAHKATEEQSKRIRKINMAHREQILNELDQHQKESNCQLQEGL